MRVDKLNADLIRALKLRFSNRKALTCALVSMLHIEKEAVYRRLRREVPFTLAEAATISSKLGISLDYLAGCNSGTGKPFQLALTEHENPLTEDFSMLQGLTTLIRRAKGKHEIEAGLATNVLPQSVFLNYEYITRFYLFKWLYLYDNKDTAKPFSEVYPSKKLKQVYRDYAEESRYIDRTTFILDPLVIQYLVNDIRFFSDIRLISPEDVQHLKNDISLILDNLESVAGRGKEEGAVKKVNIYISNINFDTSYSFAQTENISISLIAAFMLNTVVSFEESSFNRIKTWIHSLKRLSTLISESGEIQRIRFFEQQREILDTL